MKNCQIVIVLWLFSISLIFCACSNFYLAVPEDSSSVKISEESTSLETTASAGLDILNQNKTKPLPQITPAPNSPAQALPTVTENIPVADAGLSSLDNISTVSIKTEQPKEIDVSASVETKSPNECFEIKWFVPTTSVTAYHLRFGQSEKTLKGEITLPIELLIKKNDPIMGPIYSYKILCGSALSSIYIQIGSENTYGKSTFSEPVKLDR